MAASATVQHVPARTDLASPRALPPLGRTRAAAFPPRAAALPLVRSAEVESLPSPEHRFGLFGVAPVLLVQDEAGQEAEPGPASFLGLDDDARRGLAPLGVKRKDGDAAEAPAKRPQHA